MRSMLSDEGFYSCSILFQLIRDRYVKMLLDTNVRFAPEAVIRLGGTANQATPTRGGTKLRQLGRLTYHFPINLLSRYYWPVALDPAFRIREGFGGMCCGSREDRWPRS